MISRIGETRRRLIWLWRLATSTLVQEFAEGMTHVLWAFDTRNAPDGFSLRLLVGDLARVRRVTIWSFGPRGISPGSVLRFIGWFQFAFTSKFPIIFQNLFIKEFHKAKIDSRACLTLSGSFNGTFGSLVRQKLSRNEMWELQHGFLDSSYFPVHAGTFFARSRLAKEMIESRHPEVIVEIVKADLDPPRGSFERLDCGQVTEVHCFSKNPGGGCTLLEVRELETFSAKLAQRLDAAFYLHLHPRDNALKLARRHRSLQILKSLANPRAGGAGRTRLIVSSFSTALVTQSVPGDLLVNVELSDRIEPERDRQYDWLPTVRSSEDVELADIRVLRRLS